MWITELNSNDKMKPGSALWLAGDKNLNSGVAWRQKSELGVAYLHREEGQTRKTKTEKEQWLTSGGDRTKLSKHQRRQ
jgi:hypothetical protein